MGDVNTSSKAQQGFSSAPKHDRPTGPWVVVGLGNPGSGYARHRHNVGAMVVDLLAERGRAGWKSDRLLKANLATVQIGPGGTGAVCADLVRATLVRTKTFMNDSGVPTKNVLAQTKVPPSRLIVIHDELDLDFGRLRIKFGGGDNGHNGLKSIRARLGGGDYYRVRIGIGRPTDQRAVTDWVLTNFDSSQSADVPALVERAADAVESLVTSGLDLTQQRFNS
ncbi:MAG: aminoacyl-tRNA hydrolase [Propionibacteriaceae bacterium]|nr:aminoacyl-tRNA hydrolase [Propionibacteriaceae bacterium]